MKLREILLTYARLSGIGTLLLNLGVEDVIYGKFFISRGSVNSYRCYRFVNNIYHRLEIDRRSSASENIGEGNESRNRNRIESLVVRDTSSF